MSHPILIITSDPKSVKDAKELLEKADLKVKILDTTKSTLLDFLSGLAGIEEEAGEATVSTDDKSGGSKDSEAEIDPNTDSDEGTEAVVDPESDKTTENVDETPEDATKNIEKSLTDDSIVHGSIDGEEIEIHTVDGNHIVLHPITVDTTSGTNGNKVKFTLTESQFQVWMEDKNLKTEVELNIPSLKLNGMFEVEISELTQTPPVLLIGKGWIEKNTKKD